MPHAFIINPNLQEMRDAITLAEHQGFTVSTAKSLYEAQQLRNHFVPDIALVDIDLPDGSGLELLEKKEWNANTQFLITSNQPSPETVIQALRLQVTDFFPKPINKNQLQQRLTKIIESRGLTYKAIPRSEKNAGRFGRIIGKSTVMQQLYNLIERVAATNATVLICGESGTGKELVAQTLHDYSLRAKAPYIAINCGAIATDLISSALFGHEKGSFTGAVQIHQGYFEQASNGTLFLDEITETNSALQVRLLRVLETNKVIPVGGKRQITVDTRVFAATNRIPEEAVLDGTLREDLYYRLNTFPIFIPPLRERGEDISLLAQFFLDQLNQQACLHKTIHPDALATLQTWSWPGNVRELKNILHRAFILADDVINKNHVLFDTSLNTSTATITFGTDLIAAKAQFICATLEHYRNDMKKTAHVLGISVNKIKELLAKASHA